MTADACFQNLAPGLKTSLCGQSGVGPLEPGQGPEAAALPACLTGGLAPAPLVSELPQTRVPGTPGTHTWEHRGTEPGPHRQHSRFLNSWGPRWGPALRVSPSCGLTPAGLSPGATRLSEPSLQAGGGWSGAGPGTGV